MASVLVGRTVFEPVTSSVSVQGQPEFRGFDFVMSGCGSEPDGLVVRRRCCSPLLSEATSIPHQRQTALRPVLVAVLDHLASLSRCNTVTPRAGLSLP
jgi:hypothetical protein